MEEKLLYQPSQGERLGQFAAAHFVISLAGAVCAMSIGLVLVEVIGDFEVLLTLIAVAALLLMLAYGFAGVRAARVCGWEKPKNVKSAVLAFLLPALIAWGWGSLVLVCGSLMGRGWTSVASILLILSFFGAFPSSVSVFALLGFGVLDNGTVSMILHMLLVGGLPPLLFLLGSIWGSKKTVTCSDEEKEEFRETK